VDQFIGGGSIRVDRKLKSANVIDVLSDQFMLRGVPEPRPGKFAAFICWDWS
jgi:hypothetical protein